MDVISEINIINDINIIEKDLEKVNDDCKKINCYALYQAIEDTIKLIMDCITCCFRNCKKKQV